MARVVAAGVPHHITQRGNNRQDVFLLDDDRRFYLETLRERSRRHGVTLLGYCLMTNHVHLVAIPERPDSLARALGQSHSRYAQRFNRRYGRTGHLWQNRFYSCPLGRTHLVRALLYVDLTRFAPAWSGEPRSIRGRARGPTAREPIHREPLIWGVGARFVPPTIGARRWSLERTR